MDINVGPGYAEAVVDGVPVAGATVQAGDGISVVSNLWAEEGKGGAAMYVCSALLKQVPDGDLLAVVVEPGNVRAAEIYLKAGFEIRAVLMAKVKK